MTIQQITDPQTPIGTVLEAASADGLVLETPDKAQYAVIPLDDDLVDYLIERNPRFIKECEEIRQRVRAGQFHTHADVKKMFSIE